MHIYTKDGMLIAAIVGIHNRETMDMDATSKNYPLIIQSLSKAITDICTVEIDDNVKFSFLGIEPIREDDDYSRFRISVQVDYDTIKYKDAFMRKGDRIMIAVSNVNGTSNMGGKQAGTAQLTDSVSKSLQSQISNAQKQLQELSANKDITAEEKMKRRQEIQKQINDLNNQLRQHQIEKRQEQQQAKNSSTENMSGTNEANSNAMTSGSAGLSQTGMEAMISADSSVKLAKVQGSMANSMKGKVGVLEAEIKQDADRGISVEKKQETLADIKQKGQAATASQISVLADANKMMEKAADKSQTPKSTDEKDVKTDKTAKEETVKTDNKEGGDDEGAEKIYTDIDTSISGEATASQQTTVYKSVDIRL